eukprot:3940508-Rhodomonas_salina.2
MSGTELCYAPTGLRCTAHGDGQAAAVHGGTISAYARATRCPVSYASCLRACYALSGTDVRLCCYTPSYAIWGTDIGYAATRPAAEAGRGDQGRRIRQERAARMSLPTPYAMPGTDTAKSAICLRPTRCPVLT